MSIMRRPLISSLLVLTILGTSALALTPVASAVTGGTGTLYMYSDSSCTTLLPQSGGIEGYVLPPNGTPVYIQITGITEVSGSISLLLQFSGEPNEFLSATVSSGSTNCVEWTVGTFGGTLQDEPSTCATGIVRYGPADDTKVSDFYSTLSNGGSDGGHFYWGTSCGPTPVVSEIPLVGAALAGAVMLGALALYARTGRKIGSVIPK